MAQRLAVAIHTDMNLVNQHVIEAVGSLGIWPENTYVVQERLGDGPTNEIWLLTHNQQQYVLRLVKPLAAALGLSLKEEVNVISAAAEDNLTSPIIASCVSRGVVLSRFLNGRTWTAEDLHDLTQLDRLASTLRRVHALKCKVRPLDIRSTLKRYANLSKDPRATIWLDMALEQLDKLTPRTQVVCHNDLTAANIIENEGIFIIDWEYAALGDPLFDLAVVIAHCEVDDATDEHFLATYLGYKDVDALADLVRWCEVYRNLCSLWQSALE